ncbi:porin family protein [Otariodibacter oris]|uniref:Uncharacterized protein DUF560 n=1 Tax=Otariodibacter oris TaxID=1032623 RepID=A0A420XGL8_9PAST|nr:porin family protein [Otariodibacter oris]QGM81142.1 hypothetical protein A6A10_06845 [Otariodibacter oris]RKR72695.1 uncharacterized protein DUF560 [Otariodibacter oris]
MKQKVYFSVLSLATATLAFAAEEQNIISERLNDQRIQTETTVTRPNVSELPQLQNTQARAETNSVSMTKEELAQHPDLIVRALLPAVMEGNADNVELLFPLYEKLPSQYHDPILTQWSKAILAKKRQNYAESIRIYREILANQSDILPARLQLAVALFENNELEAAEDQLQRLRAEPLAPQIQQIIEQYLVAINNRDRWTFGGGFTFLNDPNINNAPKSGTTFGNWRGPKSESGRGIGFNFDIGKKWSWGDGFFNELRINSSGKYYWNNKKYNDFSARGSFGLGFQNIKHNIAVLPFIEHTWYAGGSSSSETLKHFSRSYGVTGEYSYWLSPQWQVNANYEYGEQRYDSRKHLNGHYHFVSSGLLFLANAKQYWFANVNYNRTSTRDKDDSFYRRGVSLGWGQEWGQGLSTRLSVSFAQKRYKAPMPIFEITQRNKEYGFNASIWHRAVHFWGITPRLTYNFTKTKSNHVFYSYDKHRVFIDFSKRF